MAQDSETKRVLLGNFLTNYKTSHQTAYDAAKEYLKQFPNDDDENVRYMKKWVIAYEKVLAENSAKTNNSDAGNSSGARINAERFNQMGDARAKLQEWAEAEAQYRQAVKLEPVNALYRSNLGTALENQKKFAEAETELREAVNLAPDNAQIRVSFGVLLEQQGKLPEAETEYNKATKLDPDNTKWQDKLLDVLKLQNKSYEVDKILKSRIQILTEKVQSKKSAIVKLLNSVNHQYYKHRNEIEPLRKEYADLNLQLSEIHEKQNNLEGAMNYYYQFLTNIIFKDDEELSFALKRFRELVKKSYPNESSVNAIVGQWNCYPNISEKFVGSHIYKLSGTGQQKESDFFASTKFYWEISEFKNSVNFGYTKNKFHEEYVLLGNQMFMLPKKRLDFMFLYYICKKQ